MDINEIKKDLYKSKAMAKFTHYQSGELFYAVQLESGKYQFPISTLDVNIRDYQFDGEDIEVKEYSLSKDLGSTPFDAEVRGSELIRWISKAIEKEEFIKIG